jgi:hypothetical protein
MWGSSQKHRCSTSQHSTQGIVTQMKVNFSLVMLGAVAASAIALPAEAGVLTTSNAPNGSSIELSATGITGVTVGSTTYDLTFEYGMRTEVYGATTPEYGLVTNVDALGEAILAALRGPGGASSLIDSTPTASRFNDTNTLKDFYIPKFNQLTGVALYSALPINQQNENRLLTQCFTADPNISPSDTCIDRTRSVGQDDPLMYVKLGASRPTTPGTDPSIPTPALIPGLLGMGLAAMRKKQQAA